jgi:hypothetical protein
MTPQMWTLLHEHGLPETVDVSTKLTVLQVHDADQYITAVYQLDVKDADGNVVKVKVQQKKDKDTTAFVVRFTNTLLTTFRKDLRAAFTALFNTRKTH